MGIVVVQIMLCVVQAQLQQMATRAQRQARTTASPILQEAQYCIFVLNRGEIRVKIVIEDTHQFQGNIWLIIISQF